MDAVLSQSWVHKKPAPVPVLQNLIAVIPQQVNSPFVLGKELVNEFAVVLRMTEGLHWFEGSRCWLRLALHDLEQMDDLVGNLEGQFCQAIH